MDEYILADSLLSFEELKQEDLSRKALQDYRKIPFAELTGFGGAFAELIPQFRTITETCTVDGTGLFRAFDPKTGLQLKDLQYASKQMEGAFVGALKHIDGKFDQAAFVKAGALKGTASTVAAINPALIMIGISIAMMTRKLDRIEATQKSIMQFLENEKRSELEGTLDYLLEVYNNYRYNFDNDLFRSSAHAKTQDIKQLADTNIKSYSDKINSLLDKRKLISSRIDISKNLKKLITEFANYRLSVYLYSFASLMDVLVLKNFKKEYLTEISDRIKELAYSYLVLYTKCYVLLSDAAGKTIENGVMKALSTAAKGTGKFINKIPVVERGQLDENLIKAGDKLSEYKDDSNEALLRQITTMRESSISQFAELIDSINILHNEESEILFDAENLYVKAAV